MAATSAFDALHQLISTRRSIRKWLPDPVPDEDLLLMLDAARHAPSDTNAQPWRFVVVRRPDMIAAIEDATAGRLEALAATAPREVARKVRVFARYGARFRTAPCLIIVVGKRYESRFTREIFAHLISPEALRRLGEEESIKSTALASMNLLLAAHALGYGAVPMSGPVLVAPEEIKRLLSLTEGEEPHLAVALGRPAEAPTGAGRRPLSEMVTFVD